MAHFSDLNDACTIYQSQNHGSLKLQFWNYHYHQHDILKCQVSTFNKQHNTLSTVFQDDKYYVQEQLLKISEPWTLNLSFLMAFRGLLSPLKLMYIRLEIVFDFCSVLHHFISG